MLPNTSSQTWFELFLETQLYTEIEVAFIERNLMLPSYMRILDVACSPRLHAGVLSKLGYRVVRVDLDDRALLMARRIRPGTCPCVLNGMREKRFRKRNHD